MDADRASEHFAGKVRSRADTERGVIEFADARPRLRDKVGRTARRD